MEPFFCGWSKSSLPLSKVLLEIEYPDFIVGFVHIDDKKDDVVATHELAMEEPKETGRIICSSLNKSQISLSLVKEGDNSPQSMDTRKIHELGFASFKSLPEMFDDCFRSFQEKRSALKIYISIYLY
ncbi:BnaA02g13940D [Brassica napus]|uniref:BnaA02g13940D protein n=1 Tax=Brassica napus TaxID=3708 RepID=A0A078I6X3_BRANA|nr:BnaA02g13940D [Brassica napus]